MNVVDSCGWLEYFADGHNASQFAAVLRDTDQLVVPAVAVYEVFKVLLRERGENAAFQGAAAMQRATVVDLTATLAMSAASLSLKHSLPMADSIVLAVGFTSDQELYQKLRNRVPECYPIGDCTEPGNAFQAVHQGARIAREI